MKKLVLTLIIIHLSLVIAPAQSGWFWQNPLPQGNTLNSVQFVDANIAFACGNMGTILKTINGGQNWSIVYNDTISQLVSLSFIDAQTGFACSSFGLTISTTNSGITWSVHNLSYNAPFKTIKFVNSQTGFAVTKINYSLIPVLLRTTNGGINWYNQLSIDSNYTNITGISFPNSTTGYVVGKRLFTGGIKLKLLRTSNAGLIWDTIPQNLETWPNSVFFINSTTGFIGSLYGGHGCYKTTNGGYDWIMLDTANNFDHLIFINENTGFALDENGNFQTTINGGTSWLISNFTNLSDFSAYNNNLIGISNNVILKSGNNGVNWVNVTNGYYIGYLEDIKFSNSNTGFAGTSGFILKTINGGTVWDTIRFSKYYNDDFSAVSFVNDNIWYFGDYSVGKIFKTTNCGNDWDTTYANIHGILGLDFINENTGFGITKYSGFIRTTNSGENWLKFAPFTSEFQHTIKFLNKNTGFCGSENHLYRTTNQGNNWDAVINAPVFKIQFLNNLTGYAFGYGSFFSKTTDGGLNWFKVNAPVDFNKSMSFVTPDFGYVLADGKLYKTTNGCVTWQESNIYSDDCYLLHFADSLTGYCAGLQGSILKTTTGGFFPVNPPSEIPTEFTLSQNYPNPFNPTTRIKVGIPSGINSKISLVVFDILGRKVIELVNDFMEAGIHEIIWNGNGYASGVYFYQLSTEGFSMTKKMVLIK